MGFLDALAADAYPRDSQGRRVYAPYGQRGKAFILPPEQAERLTRFTRRYFQLYFAAVLISGVAFGPWAVVTVGILWIAGYILGIAYMTRGLESATDRPSLPRDERVRRGMSAMGRPTMCAICLGGAALAMGGAWLLLRGDRNLAVWFLTAYGALVSLLYAYQLSRPIIIGPPAT